MLFLLGYNLKIIVWWGGGWGEGLTFGWGGGVKVESTGGDFYRWGVMIKFLAGGGRTPLTSPYPPLGGKTLYINGSVSQQ